MDLRYAIRMLVKSPGFTIVAVLTLTLGIGLNTSVFTLYESVAWKPLPVRSPGQMMRVYGRRNGVPLDEFTFAEYTRLRESNHSFSAIIASSAATTVLGVPPGGKPDLPQAIGVRLVSSDYFSTLGVNPPLGRAFRENEPGVVVSYTFWKQRLNGDPDVLGKTIAIQGTQLPILGVAPESFAGTGLPPQSPDLWIPFSLQPRVIPGVDWLHDSPSRVWQLLARRKAGVPATQSSAEMDVLGSAWPLVDGKRVQLLAKSATFFQTDSGEFETFGVISRVLLVAVGMVLMMGCVNLVNLLVARNAARQKEVGVRLSLGASRWRLIRQFSTESLLLGLVGGGGGLLLSVWSSEWIRISLAGALQRISNGRFSVSLDLSPDWRVFAFTAILAVLAGIGVGVWPAIRASRIDVNAALKIEGTLGRERGGRWNSRDLLLIAQVAACLVLLGGAGILFRGVWRSQTTHTGFDAKHVLVLTGDIRALASTPQAQRALVRQVVDRLGEDPEIDSIAWADRPPFLGTGSGPFKNDLQQDTQCLFNRVSNRYFDALGIPVIAGRGFTLQEIEREEGVAIISELAARAMWPGQDPLGRRIYTYGWMKQQLPKEFYTVVGIAKSVRSTFLSKPDSPFLYFPSAAPGMLLLHTRTIPETAVRGVLAGLSSVHPNLPAQSVLATLEQGPIQIQKWMAEAPASVASMLGLVALILAAVGIYGTVSYLVTMRTREIGIRIAMGATQGNVIRMVLNQGLRAVAWGTGIGLAGAIGLSALLGAMVVAPDMPDLTYGAGAYSVATFAGVLGVLLPVVALASLFPVLRATRVEPMAALRDQ